MKEKELFETMKIDIEIIVYINLEWTLKTFYGNTFRWNTLLKVLEKAFNYWKNNNWFE